MNRFILTILLVVALGALTAFGGQITERAMQPQDHFQWMKDMVHAVNNRSLSSMAVGINSGAKAKFDTTATATVICSGVFNSVSPSTANTFDTPVTTITAGKRSVFVIGVNASDEIITKQGPVVSYDYQLVIPLLDEGVAPIATIKVVATSDGQFVPNTTALDNASCTVTITNISNTPVSLNVNQR